MDKNYKNLVFTNHAFDRIQSRTITQDAVYLTVNSADQKYKTDNNGVKFIKTVKGRKVHVVANYLEKEHKWLIVSVWVRGEDDKVPFVWSLITFPFKLTYKLLIWLLKSLSKK